MGDLPAYDQAVLWMSAVGLVLAVLGLIATFWLLAPRDDGAAKTPR